MFSRQIHRLGLFIQQDGTVILQGEWKAGTSTLLHGAGGKPNPACVHPQDDLLRTHFYNGVMRAAETMKRGVRAETRGPGGPEFDVQAVVQVRAPFS